MPAVADRTQPQNLDAERSVLGAVLLRNEALDEACEHISAEDFYREAHRRIFTRMLALHERKSAIDPLTLKEELGRHGELDEVGGPAYIARLVDGVPRSTNVPHYARIVREKAILRSLIAKALNIADEAFSAEADAEDVLQGAEAAIFKLAQSETRGDLVPTSRLVPDVLPVLERFVNGQGAVYGVPTGFTDIDAFTCGMQPGDMFVVGGRSSHGKSTWAQDVSRHVACELKWPVAFFSLETSREALMLRQVIALARVDGHRVRSGYLSQTDYANLIAALHQLEESPLYIDDTPGIRPMELRSKVRRLMAQVEVKLLVVDYLQLMRPDRGTRYENRQNEVAALSQTVKGIAKELRLPALVLSQLTRKTNESATNLPTIADLRESGAIENDADVVALLHRPGRYEPDNPQYEGMAQFIIAKQRNGPQGIVTLAFNAPSARFDNMAPGYQS